MGLFSRFSGKSLWGFKSLGKGFTRITSRRAQVAQFNGWVYAASNTNANRIGKYEPEVYRVVKKRTGDELVRQYDHPMLALLRRPTRLHFSKTQMFQLLSIFLDLSGEAYWWLNTPEGMATPAEIIPLNPGGITVIKDNRGVPSTYQYSWGGVYATYPAEQVIPFRLPNPDDLFAGKSVVEAASDGINIESGAVKLAGQTFKNGGLLSGILSSEGTLGPQQIERIRAGWQRMYQGIDNAQKIAILDGKLKFQPTGQSLDDVKMLDTRTFNRDYILSLMGMSKILLGQGDTVNRATAETIEYVLAEYFIEPRMAMITDVISQRLLPLYHGGRMPNDVIVKHKNMVPKDKEFNLKRLRAGVGMPWITIDEARAEQGLPPLPDGQGATIYQNLSQVPLGTNVRVPPGNGPA